MHYSLVSIERLSYYQVIISLKCIMLICFGIQFGKSKTYLKGEFGGK